MVGLPDTGEGPAGSRSSGILFLLGGGALLATALYFWLRHGVAPARERPQHRR